MFFLGSGGGVVLMFCTRGCQGRSGDIKVDESQQARFRSTDSRICQSGPSASKNSRSLPRRVPKPIPFEPALGIPTQQTLPLPPLFPLPSPPSSLPLHRLGQMQLARASEREIHLLVKTYHLPSTRALYPQRHCGATCAGRLRRQRAALPGLACCWAAGRQGQPGG